MQILVSLALVFWHLTQRSPKERDLPNEGCEGDHTPYSKMAANNLFFCLHVTYPLRLVSMHKKQKNFEVKSEAKRAN